MDEQIQVRIAQLESDVQHIHTNVSDIKVDLRRTNDKIDTMHLRINGVEEKLGGKIDGFRTELSGKIEGVEEKLSGKIDGFRTELSGKIENVEVKLTAKIDGVDEKLTAKIAGVDEKLTAKIDDVNEKLGGRIEGVRTELGGRIEGVRTELYDLRQEIASMKIWAMGMYFALAGSLLFVMAKGFKWI
jgi:chromosome segregation ATPase